MGADEDAGSSNVPGFVGDDSFIGEAYSRHNHYLGATRRWEQWRDQRTNEVLLWTLIRNLLLRSREENWGSDFGDHRPETSDMLDALQLDDVSDVMLHAMDFELSDDVIDTLEEYEYDESVESFYEREYPDKDYAPHNTDSQFESFGRELVVTRAESELYANELRNVFLVGDPDPSQANEEGYILDADGLTGFANPFWLEFSRLDYAHQVKVLSDLTFGLNASKTGQRILAELLDGTYGFVDGRMVVHKYFVNSGPDDWPGVELIDQPPRDSHPVMTGDKVTEVDETSLDLALLGLQIAPGCTQYLKEDPDGRRESVAEFIGAILHPFFEGGAAEDTLATLKRGATDEVSIGDVRKLWGMVAKGSEHLVDDAIGNIMRKAGYEGFDSVDFWYEEVVNPGGDGSQGLTSDDTRKLGGAYAAKRFFGTVKLLGLAHAATLGVVQEGEIDELSDVLAVIKGVLDLEALDDVISLFKGSGAFTWVDPGNRPQYAVASEGRHVTNGIDSIDGPRGDVASESELRRIEEANPGVTFGEGTREVRLTAEGIDQNTSVTAARVTRARTVARVLGSMAVIGDVIDIVLSIDAAMDAYEHNDMSVVAGHAIGALGAGIGVVGGSLLGTPLFFVGLAVSVFGFAFASLTEDHVLVQWLGHTNFGTHPGREVSDVEDIFWPYPLLHERLDMESPPGSVPAPSDVEVRTAMEYGREQYWKRQVAGFFTIVMGFEPTKAKLVERSDGGPEAVFRIEDVTGLGPGSIIQVQPLYNGRRKRIYLRPREFVIKRRMKTVDKETQETIDVEGGGGPGIFYHTETEVETTGTRFADSPYRTVDTVENVEWKGTLTKLDGEYQDVEIRMRLIDEADSSDPLSDLVGIGEKLFKRDDVGPHYFEIYHVPPEFHQFLSHYLTDAGVESNHAGRKKLLHRFPVMPRKRKEIDDDFT